MNGTASLVDAIKEIQGKYNTPGHYRIQFATCLCKEVVKNERIKLMNNHKQKQYFKAMQQPKKKIISGKKKQARDMKNKREILKKNCFEIQNN